MFWQYGVKISKAAWNQLLTYWCVLNIDIFSLACHADAVTDATQANGGKKWHQFVKQIWSKFALMDLPGATIKSPSVIWSKCSNTTTLFCSEYFHCFIAIQHHYRFTTAAGSSKNLNYHSFFLRRSSQISMCFLSLKVLHKTFSHLSHFFAMATFLASLSSSVNLQSFWCKMIDDIL